MLNLWAHHDSIKDSFGFYLSCRNAINRSINQVADIINRSRFSNFLARAVLSSRRDIGSLIVDYANHVRGRSFRETIARTLQAMVVNRWVVQRNIMKESDVDAIVISRYVSGRTSVGWSFPASRKRDRWSLVL